MQEKLEKVFFFFIYHTRTIINHSFTVTRFYPHCKDQWGLRCLLSYSTVYENKNAFLESISTLFEIVCVQKATN